MKTMSTLLLVITVLIFFVIPGKTLAAGNDTLTVYASSSSIDEVINSDTTSDGSQKHLVYKLVSRDTTYLWLGPVTVKSDFQVIGVLGTDGRPPCIQSGVLQDGSLPYYLFIINGTGTIAKFKNLYITGLATNNTINALNVNGIGSMIQVSADSVKLYVDNVVFSDFTDEVIGYTGNWDSFFITNCKFRNLISATQWFSGEALRNSNNVAITDTIFMHNNTFLAMNCYDACPVTASYVRYFDFQHNSDVMTFQNPFWIFNVTEAKIDNNMFYGTWLGGITQIEYVQYWDELRSLDIPSVLDLDTLGGDIPKMFDPEDSSSTNFKWLAEAKRQIEVKNNNFYEPQEVTAFWQAYDDTAHGDDSLYFARWMNDRTSNMFSDKTHWPGLTESGNTNIDPSFGQSILDVLNNGKGNGVGEFQYFMDIRGNTASTDIYGYQLSSVSGDNWIPDWPLPELQDMQYTNASLMTGGTDGKPVGDPGWFTNGYTGIANNHVAAPNKFTLYDAYPNPFNPSTNVKFSIAQAGVVSLKIFNSIGQLVKTVVDNAYKAKGDYNVIVNMNNLASGVYFYRLEEGNNIMTKKMVLLK